MRLKAICANFMAVATLSGVILAPAAVNAQDRYRDHDYRNDQRDRTRYHRNNDRRDREEDRRQQTKNEWRNIAIGSGALGVLGLLNHDNTLTFAGAAGSLYSLNRYEQDRRSQSRLERTRAEYFSRPYFYRDGDRFSRRTVERHGQRYYQFYRD